MTMQQLKYILKISECGSLNEAAKQLFIAQSSLSVSVRSLEQELNITIFERTGNGVYLTEEGAEFTKYARQLVEQNDLIIDRYCKPEECTRLLVCTQHYDFVADIFSRLLNETEDGNFLFSLREMKTYDVIYETEIAYCDIGIIAIKSSDYSAMERYVRRKGLSFTPLLTVPPHVYLRKEHPLSKHCIITSENLINYPYVSYEQGDHSSSFFTEEIGKASNKRRVEISDRASLMNVLLATDCVTIGTGIMPSALNEDRIVSIPFDSDDHYTIGYLLRNDRKISDMTKKFIQMLVLSLKD